jgi:hypothetical protein
MILISKDERGVGAAHIERVFDEVIKDRTHDLMEPRAGLG